MSEGRYTAELSKTAAAVGELREVLGFWEPGMTTDELAKRVLAEGGLGRSSATRVNDIVRRTFAQRLLRPDDTPARRVKAALQAGISESQFRDLMLLYTLRAQPPIYDFLVERYWPAVFAGHEAIDGREIAAFLRDKSGTERNPDGWSAHVTARVARNLGKALTDFGFFENRRSPIRTVRYWNASEFLLAYILVEAHQDGRSDSELLQLAEWAAFGFNERERVQRLLRMAGVSGPFLFQYSGEIAQFTWHADTVEDLVVDASAGTMV